MAFQLADSGPHPDLRRAKFESPHFLDLCGEQKPVPNSGDFFYLVFNEIRELHPSQIAV